MTDVEAGDVGRLFDENWRATAAPVDLSDVEGEEEDGMRWSAVPRRRGLDRSDALEAVGPRWLAEVQLAFAALLVGHSYRALNQWRKLVEVACQAGDAMEDVRNGTVFSAFVRTLAAQLAELPEDFFSAELLKDDNFLRAALEALFEYAAGTAIEAAALDEIRAVVRRRFGAELLAEMEDELAGVTLVES